MLTFNSILGKKRQKARCSLRSSDVNLVDKSGKVLFEEIYLIRELQTWKIKKIYTGSFHNMKYIKLISKQILLSLGGMQKLHQNTFIISTIFNLTHSNYFLIMFHVAYVCDTFDVDKLIAY